MLTRRQLLGQMVRGSSAVALASGTLSPEAFASDKPAERHRLLVLDIGREGPLVRPGSEHHQLLLVDVESGKIVARQGIGTDTSLAVSPKGDVLAAIYIRRGEGIFPPIHLDFYRGSDLKRLDSGLLPTIPRMGYQLGAASDSWLSPNGKALIVQGPEYHGQNAHMATTVLNCVKRELDRDGYFKLSEKLVGIPRAHGVDVVSVADWPRVHVWNRNLNLLYVVDFSTGKTLSKLLITDDPVIEKTDPANLEMVNEDLLHCFKHHGWMFATGGRFAYYVPMSWAPPGHVRKIDLSADPPKVVRTWKDRLPDLETGFGAVSEKAGRIYLLKSEPLRVKVLSADDLTAKQEMKLSLTECDELATSRDGKYLYALDSEAAKVAVIDCATGKEVKVLDGLGAYPHVMLALADSKAEK